MNLKSELINVLAPQVLPIISVIGGFIILLIGSTGRIILYNIPIGTNEITIRAILVTVGIVLIFLHLFLPLYKNKRKPVKSKSFKSINFNTKEYIKGKWRVSASDVRVSEIMNYSFLIKYSGEFSITEKDENLLVTGTVIGLSNNQVTQWEFFGQITQKSDNYYLISYRQTNEILADTIGSLLFKTETDGTHAKGFFIAKRAITDKIGKKSGFGFGNVELIKMHS